MSGIKLNTSIAYLKGVIRGKEGMLKQLKEHTRRLKANEQK